jgi:hypothetical protein
LAREQKKQREQVQKEKEKEKEQQAAAAEAAKVAETTTQLHRSTTTATHAEPELSTASITTAGPVPTTPQAPAMATIATATATPINHAAALPVQLFAPSTDSYGSYHSALAAAVEYLLTEGKGQAEFKKIEGIWDQYKEGTPQKQRYGNIVGLVRYRRQEKKKLQEIVESASKKQKVN